MHVGRSATVTGHRIICNMHSSAVSPADTSYIEQIGGAPIRRVRIGLAIQAHYSHEVPQCGKAAFDLDSTKSLPDICHVGSRNDGQQWRCVPRNCFPTPVLGGAVACPVHRFEIFGGPRRTNRPPATPGLRYSTIRY
ncbi:hypothetical protein BO85DRAFT_460809 [Aspergillus piperis CBS 112811]|uniref:Uncharacterized protein n=1 Tax=Aspergillus piperis CBS 112811 TaxID=1448313 RepID=A0A8G1VMH5_9EURO|nr:hypothetical protein BO85DRAFT_460809 [Aspergillus piperis CBS 112811]RAH55703.1 hypothetical protein BO85DRAFT_460809 [Aspergillus piperis CBS 112811]